MRCPPGTSAHRIFTKAHIADRILNGHPLIVQLRFAPLDCGAAMPLWTPVGVSSRPRLSAGVAEPPVCAAARPAVQVSSSCPRCRPSARDLLHTVKTDDRSTPDDRASLHGATALAASLLRSAGPVAVGRCGSALPATHRHGRLEDQGWGGNAAAYRAA
jgi:hypothetical protein